MKRIIYNRNKCISCGSCVIRAPHIWQLNPTDGKADLLDGDLKKDNYFRMLWPDEELLVQEIVAVCPTRAINII